MLGIGHSMTFFKFVHSHISTNFLWRFFCTIRLETCSGLCCKIQIKSNNIFQFFISTKKQYLLLPFGLRAKLYILKNLYELSRHIEGGIAAWHAIVFFVAHAVIDIVWIMFGERFRDNRNVNSDVHFLLAKKGLDDCL